jgi:NADPH:quinone reductase-like Zn-dependent oxidoreductase
MAANTPLKRYKQNTHGGGIRDPLVVRLPPRVGLPDPGGLRHQFCHVADLAPTLLDLLDVEPAATMEGTSFATTLADADSVTSKHTQYFEMFGHRGIWHRGWKAVAWHRAYAPDHEDIALKPKRLTMEESAAVPLVALAAWQALVDVAQVKPGQKVLVHAGAGGLGSTAVQVAKHLGAYVATTARSNDEEKLRDLGANEVIDYTKADFAALLSGYDLVLDSLGGDNLAKSLTVLRPGGLAISVVGPPDGAFAGHIGRPLLKPLMSLMSRKVRARARKLGVRYSFFFMRSSGAQLKTLAALYDAGKLRPVLDRTFPFDDTLDAMEYLEQGRAKGKIVITMMPSEKQS